MVDQAEIHQKVLSSIPQERKEAILKLNENFSMLSNKVAAWSDLTRLVSDENREVRRWAAFALGSVFFHVPDKSAAWSDLIHLISDENSDVRKWIAPAISSVFPYVPDKSAAWSDLIRLISNENRDVRKWVAPAISSVFPYVPDKSAAWSDLICLTDSKYDDVRSETAFALGSAFPHVSDKSAAWSDFHRLTGSKYNDVRRWIAFAIGSVFPHVPDKSAAWSDLILLTADKFGNVRLEAAFAIGLAFPHVPDKCAAWSDLHNLTGDKYKDVRKCASSALGSAFSHFLDKSAAWSDLHRLNSDKDSDVRSEAASALGKAFLHVPDKSAIWSDLHNLVGDEDGNVRSEAASALGKAFPHVPDKSAAWSDLHNLISDKDCNVRSKAASALGSAFPHVPDKSAAWSDLHSLTNDDDINVRSGAAFAFGPAFCIVPYKSAAWSDLHNLISDKNSDVRLGAASALGSAFPHLPDKSEAWDNLLNLAEDQDKNVRVFANHSLGKISIFKATESENEADLRKELTNSLYFFERSASEAVYFNPSKFCLPFYRSFYIVTFISSSSEVEVEACLAETKKASEGSNSKEELFGVVESLASALREAKRLSNTNLEGVKFDLKVYMQYCNRAVELLEETEGHAPGATKLIKRGLPIINRRIKYLLREIEEESIRFREITRQTPFEPLGRNTCERISGIAWIECRVDAERIMEESLPDIRTMCHFLPERSSASVCELRNWEILDFESRVVLFQRAISHCSNQMENFYRQIQERDKSIDYLRKEVIIRLDNINYNIFRIKIVSGNATGALAALKWELKKIDSIKADMSRIDQRLEDLDVFQQRAIIELKHEMPRIIGELKELVLELDDKQILGILEELQTLKKSQKEVVFEDAASLITIVSFILKIIGIE